MKKGYKLLFVLVLMFFCVYIDSAEASFGITCYYAGSCKYRWVDNQSSHTTDNCTSAEKRKGKKNCRTTDKHHVDYNYGVSYGIDYWCTSPDNCEAWGRGYLKEIKEGSSSENRTTGNEISASGYNQFFDAITTSNKDLFGVGNNGPTKCPDNLTIYDLEVGGHFGNGAGGIGAETGYRNKTNSTERNCTIYKTGQSSYNEGQDANMLGNLEGVAKSLDNKGADFHIYEPGTGNKQYGRSEDNGNSTNINDKFIDLIKNWAGNTNVYNNGAVNYNSNCSGILSNVAPYLKSGISIISIAGVVLLVIFMSTDFVKAITSGEDDGLLKAFNNSKKRIIAVIILLLLPLLLNFLINLVNDNIIQTNGGQIKIGKVSDCVN